VIRKRNSSHVGAVLKLKPVYRIAAMIPAALNHPNRGTSSMAQQGAQVAVSRLLILGAHCDRR